MSEYPLKLSDEELARYQRMGSGGCPAQAGAIFAVYTPKIAPA